VLTHRFSPRTQSLIERGHHVLIAIFGGIAAWYGWKLCLLNRTLATPGLEINLAVLYASCLVGGILLVVYAISMIVAPPPVDPDAVH
jgi:TRAP-type C4-dicarboxylate transport system permease small subunit